MLLCWQEMSDSHRAGLQEYLAVRARPLEGLTGSVEFTFCEILALGGFEDPSCGARLLEGLRGGLQVAEAELHVAQA